MNREPFWEKAYRTGASDPFGGASPEILELLTWLPAGSSVLDLGCGAGRNALPLARAGMKLTAVDVSEAACAMITKIAAESSLPISVVQEDLRTFDFTEQYDVVIAHGILHLLPAAERLQLLDRIKARTRPNGANVVAVFTSRIPAPPDLSDAFIGLFEEDELFNAYQDWETLLRRSYTLNDEHPGGIRHEHPVNKIVARKRA